MKKLLWSNSRWKIIHKKSYDPFGQEQNQIFIARKSLDVIMNGCISLEGNFIEFSAWNPPDYIIKKAKFYYKIRKILP